MSESAPVRTQMLTGGTGRARRSVGAGLIAGIAVALLAVAPARAATLQVTNAANSGPGSLRSALLTANSNGVGDVVRVETTGTVQLLSPLPPLSTAIEIRGPGASAFIVRRNSGGAYPVFWVFDGVKAAISGIGIQNGRPQTNSGGGILNQGTLTLSAVALTMNRATGGVGVGFGGAIFSNGSLTVRDSTLTANVATGNHGSSGGAIFSNGVLNLVRTTVDGNRAEGTGSGIGGAGGIAAFGPTTITASTISNNTATGNGGGLVIGDTADAQLTNDTIAGNRSGAGGGGIFASGQTLLASVTVARNAANYDNVGSETGGGLLQQGASPFTVRNSVLALNTITAGANRNDCSGTFASNSHNLLTNAFACNGFSGADILTSSPRLGPLGANGGPTKTVAPASDSPAIGGSQPGTTPGTDQRGVIRDVTPDIGAYEAN